MPSFRALERRLKEDGWVLVCCRGSHRQYKNASKPGRVTLAGKDSDTVSHGILNSVMRQAGLR